MSILYNYGITHNEIHTICETTASCYEPC
uniref:Uncharacterized protein n=1 Tax=Anguilla anguilla TaxID=7936 RepID=A0A0E9P5L4_ANGAN